MDVEIILTEDDTNDFIKIENTSVETHVFITVHNSINDEEFSIQVSIEELKHALRKISCK